MIPEGHEPTREDRDQWTGDPSSMYYQIQREGGRLLECTYTHYSRSEQIGARDGFIRRFSRGASDPFTAPQVDKSKSFLGLGSYVDDTGHHVFTVGDP